MNSVILERRWSVASIDPSLTDDLARKAGVPALIAHLLTRRGMLDRDEVASHLTPSLASLSDPWTMADMEQAVRRIVKAVSRREAVGLFGDYDADGVTATALVARFFMDIGLRVVVHLPHREQEGYGLNRDAIDSLASRGCTLMVTVDCGVTDHDEVAFAGKAGMDVIVTDHHQPLRSLPDAEAVLNPRRRDCSFPFKDLAGVGVAFNLIRAVRQRLYELGHWSRGDVPNLKASLDLVAVGTVADVMPLLGDNRILVRAGLDVLESGSRPGFMALKQQCGIRPGITSDDIAMRLSPRINAAGRMAHADIAYKLLVTEDADEARRLASRLHQLNQERQAETTRIVKEAMAMARELGDRPAYVLGSPDWKRGLAGLVASRLSEQFQRPSIILSLEDDKAYGSGRSPEGINLYEIIAACSEHLSGFGGHRTAAGLHLPVDAIDAFSRNFEQKVDDLLGRESLTHPLDVDARATVDELCDAQFSRFFELLEPFGAGYPAPLFAIRDFNIHSSGVVGNNHLKLTLAPLTSAAKNNGGGIDLMGWGHGDKLHLPWNELELACRGCFNHWRGRKRFELRLTDVRYKK